MTLLSESTKRQSVQMVFSFFRTHNALMLVFPAAGFAFCCLDDAILEGDKTFRLESCLGGKTSKGKIWGVQ
jgi:hypothetical protein